VLPSVTFLVNCNGTQGKGWHIRSKVDLIADCRRRLFLSAVSGHQPPPNPHTPLNTCLRRVVVSILLYYSPTFICSCGSTFDCRFGFHSYIYLKGGAGPSSSGCPRHNQSRRISRKYVPFIGYLRGKPEPTLRSLIACYSDEAAHKQ
jgi:hypothetical protein